MNSRRFLRQTTAAAEATLAQQKSIKLSLGIKEENSLIYQFVIFDGLQAFKTCVDLPSSRWQFICAIFSRDERTMKINLAAMKQA